MANSWYIYNGVGDPFIPASYGRITITPTCVDGPNVCVIYLLGVTDPVPVNPFSSNILNYIANGLATLTRKPSIGAQKPYVYLKNC